MSDEHEHVEGCCETEWTEAQQDEMRLALAQALGEIEAATATELLEAAIGLPIRGRIRPTVLLGTLNGRLPSSLLAAIDSRGGQGLVILGRCWRAMRAACLAETGIDLWYTGVYRTFQRQIDLLLSRTTIVPDPRAPWKRYWDGTPYGHHKGYYYADNGGSGPYPAMVAKPGESNHGDGASIDMALRILGLAAPQPLTSASLNWLVRNAERFNLTWESQSEPWHVTLIDGNNVPPAVLAYEQDNPNPPDPPKPPIPKEDDEMKLYVVGKDYYERQNGMWVHVQDGNYVAWYVANEATLGKPVPVDAKYVTAANTVEARQIAYPPVTPPTNVDDLPTNAEMQAAFSALSQQIGQLPDPIAAAVVAAVQAALAEVDWGSLIEFPVYKPEVPA